MRKSTHVLVRVPGRPRRPRNRRRREPPARRDGAGEWQMKYVTCLVRTVIDVYVHSTNAVIRGGDGGGIRVLCVHGGARGDSSFSLSCGSQDPRAAAPMSWLNSSGSWLKTDAPPVPSLLDSSEVWAVWRRTTYEYLEREWGGNWANACCSVRAKPEDDARTEQARLRHAAVERAALTDRAALHQDAALRAARAATGEVVEAERATLERARAARLAQQAEAERAAAEQVAAGHAAAGEEAAIQASQERAAAEKATVARVEAAMQVEDARRRKEVAEDAGVAQRAAVARAERSLAELGDAPGGARDK